MWKIKYRIEKSDIPQSYFYTTFDEAYEELRFLIEEIQAYQVEITEVSA